MTTSAAPGPNSVAPVVAAETAKLTFASFEKLQHLGEGSVGTVSKVKHRESGKVYALKAMDKQRILAIVEANFGSSMQFNLSCRQILSSKLAATTGTSSTPKKGATRLFDKRDVSVAV